MAQNRRVSDYEGERYQKVRTLVVFSCAIFLVWLHYRAMQFLKECDILKIEDILPFFEDVVTIDQFKVYSASG